MAENRKGNGAGLYYLSKSQVVLVTAGFALTCVIVFLLGIVIGQGIEQRKLLKQDEPLAKVPIQPPAAAKSGQETPGKDDQLTFYDTLGKGGGTAPAKEAPAEKPASAKPAAEAQPEVKEVKAAAKTPPDVPTAKETKVAKITPTDAAAVQKKEIKAEKPAAEDAAAKSEDDKSKSDAPRDWTVQVNAYPDERSAQHLADRLKQKGYDAYVATKNINGRDWYRVRVGHFPTRTQAREYLEQIQTKETKENFTKAIAVSK